MHEESLSPGHPSHRQGKLCLQSHCSSEQCPLSSQLFISSSTCTMSKAAVGLVEWAGGWMVAGDTQVFSSASKIRMPE